MYFFRNRWAQLVMIMILTSLPYLNIFTNGFAIDDHVFIGNYHPSVVEAFRGAVPPGHEGVYRPVRGILYTLYYNLFGTTPFFYHLHSLLVHLAATVLVYLIAEQIFNFQFSIFNQFSKSQFSKYVPLVTALLFGLHPIHTESITYIAASMDATGVVFMLGAFLLYLRQTTRKIPFSFSLTLLLSYFLAIMAFFTYEMTLTLPLLLVLYEEVLGRLGGLGRLGRYKKILPYFAGAGVYVFVRFGMLGVGSRGPYLANSVYLTAITMPRVVVQYLLSLLWPVNLTNNHIIAPGIEAFVYRGYRTAAIAAQSILDPEILGAIGMVGAIGVVGWKMRKKYPLVSFGIGWIFLALLPVMEIVPQGSIFNERMLYIPSVGWVAILAYAISNLQFTIYKQFSIFKFQIIIVVLIGLLYGVRTVVRNADWHDDVTLWQKDVAIYPTESAYARFALGNAYNSRKDYQKAVEQYQKSVEINPGFAVGYASLSRTYRDLGNTELSNVNYQMAQNAEPGFWGKP